MLYWSIMNRLYGNKLNNLMANYPAEGVLTSAWLEKHGYYKQLVKQYCDSGWLTRLGRGAYSRLNDSVTWEGAVAALQKQLQIPVHVGGLTALALYGVSQYVPLSTTSATFFLFNSSLNKITLPAWFLHYFQNGHYYQKKLFSNNCGVSGKKVGNIELQASTPERAILEVLALTPDKVTLQHASELMESLHRLRSSKVQDLLESCLSVKVKRLFLCLSEEHNLDFFGELNLKKINLGGGKRVIGQGGTYYAKWQLSLPSGLFDEFSLGEEEDA